MNHKQSFLSLGMAAMIGLSPVVASAQEAAKSRTGSPSWEDFTRLENQVREQRQLMIQLMQTEQQRYDMLLKLIGSSGDRLPSLPLPSPATGASPLGAKPAPRAARAGDVPERRFGLIEGKVDVPGNDTSDVYVYVSDVKGGLGNDKIEIKQENKQFTPRHAVVQAGTTVTFPNLDPVFHNVFSTAPKNGFDLGTYRAGDTARSVRFTSPGVVDIFCNMHQRMSSSVLVVPSRFWAKVKPDGSFRLDGVPVGTRSVVAWGPKLKPAQQKVELGAGAAKVSFAMEYTTDHKSHSNKFGQAYGSYKE